MSQIQLIKAIDRGVRKVSWWWLPLCTISLIIVFTQNWLPELTAQYFDEWKHFEPYRTEIKVFEAALDKSVLDFSSIYNFRDQLIVITSDHQMQKHISTFCTKMALALSCISFVACFLYVFMIIFSKSAILGKGKSTLSLDSKRAWLSTIGFAVLAVIKVVSILIFIPGIYFYIRLMFTGIIITEKSANPFLAIYRSWILTRGEFRKLFMLFIFELVLNVVAVITVIGVVPIPPLRYTIRTSVYLQLKGLSDE